MSVHLFQFRFVYKKKSSNLAGHIRWLSHIASPAFAEDWRQKLLTQSNLKELVQQAQQVIEEEIYTHGKGEGNIKKSMDAIALGEKDVRMVLFSDPTVAPSKGPFKSGNPAEFSYAAFFEDPQFNSFIPPRSNPYDKRRYRPFFQPMNQAHFAKAREMSRKSILRTIRMRMPKISGV